MGVLDDAIREHLDLKRRHGASDDEIARAEAEALGPARREVDEPSLGPAGPVRVQPMADPAPPPDLALDAEDAGDEVDPVEDDQPFDHGGAFDDEEPTGDDEPFRGTHAVHDIDEDTLPGTGRLSD
jgi:hypothetical protein